LEQFAELGVKLIAVADSVDAAKGEDDFTPFRTILALRVTGFVADIPQSRRFPSLATLDTPQ
jgi:hypothetical protein